MSSFPANDEAGDSHYWYTPKKYEISWHCRNEKMESSLPYHPNKVDGKLTMNPFQLENQKT